MAFKWNHCLTAVFVSTTLALGWAPDAKASLVGYKVSLDTAFLGTATQYVLDFEFAAGDSVELNPNTVTVTSLTGDFATFDLTAGDPMGNGENVVEFVPANPTSFTLDFTSLFDPVTPDLLSIYVCDESLVNCVGTTDPFGSVVSFTESVDPNQPGIASYEAFDTVNSDFNTSITSTPEPSTIAFGGSALALGAVCARRRKAIPSDT